MDVRAAAANSASLESLVPLRGSAASLPRLADLAETPQDSVATLLQLLSTPQLADLLSSIDAQRFPPDPALLNTLLQTAATAVAAGDVPRALAAVSEYIHRSPESAATLLKAPALFPIQAEVKALLHRITEDAKTESERLLDTAGQSVTAATKHPHDLNAPGVLAIAERLIDSGQLINYYRASELSQSVIALYFGVVPGTVPSATSPKREASVPQRWKLPELAKTLWRRVPLLVLLLSWLALGIAGGTTLLVARLAGWELLKSTTSQLCFDIWATGFLALIVFQFLVTVRHGWRVRK